MKPNSTFYCQDALKLVQEAKRTRETNIPMYRDDLIRKSLLEINHLSEPKKHQVVSLMNKTCIQRSKRCVLAYQRERLDRFKEMLWDIGISTCTQLPTKAQLTCSTLEQDFIKQYKQLVVGWKGEWLNVDLGGSLKPPKDVFVEVRVVRECGEIMTEMGPILLTLGSQHYLKRTDVEDLILSGDLKHVI